MLWVPTQTFTQAIVGDATLDFATLEIATLV